MPSSDGVPSAPPALNDKKNTKGGGGCADFWTVFIAPRSGRLHS